MKIQFVIMSCVLLVLAFTGCSKDTSAIINQQEQTVCQTVREVVDLRVVAINSPRSSLDEKQRDVIAELERFVNSGQHGIVAVQTSYTNEYLTSAEVKYSAAAASGNRKLRVRILVSPRYFLDEKQLEVQTVLNLLVNGGIRDVVDVHTTMFMGYLIAAEVYYNEA